MGHIIEVPDERRPALEAKREEYRARYEAQRAEEPYRHPAQLHSFYKFYVLDRVLEEKRLDTWEVSQELEKEGFDLEVLANAFGVIDDYCRTGGKNARGGTGLRDPSDRSQQSF